jgi:hypothetical protein
VQKTGNREQGTVKPVCIDLYCGLGGDWFGSGENCSEQRKHGSKSSSRKAASAMIAKIPFALAQHIARTFKPQGAFSVPCSLIPDPCSQAVN